MRLRTLTKWVVLLVPAGLFAYDLAAFLVAGDQATISRTVLAWNDSCALTGFVVTFAAGAIASHFWVPQHPDPAADKVPGWRAKGGT